MLTCRLRGARAMLLGSKRFGTTMERLRRIWLTRCLLRIARVAVLSCRSIDRAALASFRLARIAMATTLEITSSVIASAFGLARYERLVIARAHI